MEIPNEKDESIAEGAPAQIGARRWRDRQRYKGARAEQQRQTAADYYASHRDETRQRLRDKYRAALQFVTDEEQRKQLLADPRRAIGKDFVVCLECWQRVPGMLNNAHLKQHGITAVEYKGIHGYSKNTALVSEGMAAKLSARRRCDPQLLAAHGGVARPDLTAVPSAEIVARWLLENKTTKQIAKETGLTMDEVHVRLRRIFGLHPRADMRRVHGEIVGDVWLDKLLRRFGDVYKSEIARPMGVSRSRLYSISKRRKSLALVGQSAERLIRLERDMLVLLFHDKGKQPQHFRAAVPDLPEKYEAARDGIALLRPFVEQDDQLKRVMNELCTESQLATAKGEESRARTILLWVPEILSWLARNQTKLHRKASALTLEFLAEDYYTKGWVVQRSLSGTHGEPTDLATIHSIVATSLRTRGPARKKRGRPREAGTTNRIEAIAAFLRCGERQKDFAPYVYPDRPASAYDSLRRFKNKHEDRIEAAIAKLTIQKAETLVKSLKILPKS
jgi:hypothetical protein